MTDSRRHNGRRHCDRRSGALAAVCAAACAAVFLALLGAGADPAAAGTGTSVTTTRRGWSVTLRVARASVRAGGTIDVRLIIDNRTGHRATVPGCAADGTFAVGLANARIANAPFSGAVACGTVLRPGRSVFEDRVRARFTVCGGGGDGSPPCDASALPPGAYHTVVSWPEVSGAGPPAPGVLTIRVTR